MSGKFHPKSEAQESRDSPVCPGDSRGEEAGVEGLMGRRLCLLGGGIASSCPHDHLVPPAHYFHLKNGASTSRLKLASLTFVL